MNNDVIQTIGADLGRGCTKGYTMYNGNPKRFICRSIIASGRPSIDYTKHESPVHIEIDGKDYFVGDLAELEGTNPRPNTSDDKTTKEAEILLYTLIHSLAKTDMVQLNIGVPNKMFTKKELNNIQMKYKGKKVKIRSLIDGITKDIEIVDVKIFREADAALLYTVKTSLDKETLMKKRIGMATIGFRTTELSYFDKGLKFVDKYSDTLELGNKTVLEDVQKKLKGQVTKTLSEIDVDSDYDNLKKPLYQDLMFRINQELENKWSNYKEMIIFVAGGTILNCDLNDIGKDVKMAHDPQFVTAKGLYDVMINM